MVRVGGGWDTLENYLNKHDPCRCPSDQYGKLKALIKINYRVRSLFFHAFTSIAFGVHALQNRVTLSKWIR